MVATYTLQLLHFSDGEAGLLAGDTAPYLAALVDGFDDDFENTIILAGGDNFLPGPFLAAGTDPSVGATHSRGTNPGAADIEIHNIIGVQASTIGNHEFDLGTNALSDAINDTIFPYLSSNLDFSGDGALAVRYQETVGVGGLEEASTLARKIVPSAIISEGGEVIGLVGATTQIVERISSTGGVEVKGFPGDGNEADNMTLLAAQLQPVINDLIAQGVDKIILMTHLQHLQNEKTLASLLTGVDIILSAGSNTRLGDLNDLPVEFPGHGANFADTYPLVINGADNKPTLIVNTDNEYTYLGRLVVDFDENGDIVLESLVANSSINGAYASTSTNVAAAWGTTVDNLDSTAFAQDTKGDKVRDITTAVDAVIAAKDGEVFGFTDVYLEGERAFVRSQETNLGNISADANLFVASQALGGGQPFMISIKNGGGIRAQIGAVDFLSGEKIAPIANPDAGKPEGAVSKLDVENALRFNNRLMVFDTTAAELKNILEFTAGITPGNGGYSQLGGLRYAFDRTKPAGQRVSSISLIDENDEVIARVVENGVVSSEAPALITAVILNFTANGGDGYPIKANGTNFRYLLNNGSVTAAVDETLDFTAESTMQTVGASTATLLGEQQAFQEFMTSRHGTPETAYEEADTPASQDMRIQNLAVRKDAVFLGMIYNAGDNGESISGTSGDDTLNGGAGNDVIEGGIGRDVMLGKAGNDFYKVDRKTDKVIELAGAGFDTVSTFLTTYVLPANVERVNYEGTGNFVGIGNAGGNRFTGNIGSDRFVDVLGGNDTVSGGDGVDSMDFRSSGTGVILDFVTNVHSGAAAGDVYSSIERFFGSNTAADSMTGGGAGRFIFAGGGGNDTLVGAGNIDNLQGQAGDDSISGLAGVDSLDGGAGNDTLMGGAARDFFIYSAAGFGQDVITDFQDELDKLKVHSSVGNNITAFNITGNGTTSVLLTQISAPANTISLQGTSAITITSADFLFY